MRGYNAAEKMQLNPNLLRGDFSHNRNIVLSKYHQAEDSEVRELG